MGVEWARRPAAALYYTFCSVMMFMCLKHIKYPPEASQLFVAIIFVANFFGTGIAVSNAVVNAVGVHPLHLRLRDGVW